MNKVTTGLTNYDPRQYQQMEANKMLQLQMQTLARDQLEAKSIWADKQAKLYNNTIQIGNPTPT